MASLVIARQRILMALTSLGNRSRNFSEKINLVGIEKPVRTVKEKSASSKLDEMITEVRNDSLVNVSQPFISDYWMQLKNKYLMLHLDVEKLKTDLEKICCEDRNNVDNVISRQHLDIKLGRGHLIDFVKKIVKTCEKEMVKTREKQFAKIIKEQQLKDATYTRHENYRFAVSIFLLLGLLSRYLV